MDDFVAFIRRQPGLSAWRALLIFSCGVFVYYSATTAFVASAQYANAALATRLVPDDPVALAILADQRFTSAAMSNPVISKSTKNSISKMARESLKRQAINPGAFRVLGYVADIDNRPVLASQFMAISARMSRRDFGTNLWLIENSVNKGDMDEVLFRYDILLRSIADSRQMLFPRLASALEDTTIQAAFAKYLKIKPNWLPAFLAQAIGASERPSIIAETLERGGGMPEGPEYKGLDTYLVERMAAKGEYAAALHFFKKAKGANPSQTRSIAFDQSSTDARFAPITWMLPSSTSFSAAFEVPQKGSARQLRIFIASGERGIVARKLVAFPPGAYEFADRRQDVQPSDGNVHWEMSCVKGDRASIFWSAPASGRVMRVAGPTISTDCPIQILDLVGSGGSNSAGIEVIIGEVRLEKSIRRVAG